MPRQPARRMSRLGTETAFEVLARARALEAQGRSVVHLEIGEPDFDTPPNIVEAGCRALQRGETHYGPAQGQPALRQAVASELSRNRGVEVDPEEVLICPGGKPVMFYMLLALAEPGMEVIHPDPGFPIYESMIDFTGATAVSLPLLEERDFGFDADALEALITDRTGLLVLNSPSNPTGGLLPRELLREIARIAVARDLWVLSDEIYSRIIYEGRHESVLSFPGMKERTVVLDGFSKTYAMTGWRLGYAVGPRDLVQEMTRLQVNSASCTASFTQSAGVEALCGPQDAVEGFVKTFRERRDRIVEGLNGLPGVSCRRPKGAFYVFPNIRDTGRTSQELAELLLQEAGVAVLPGTAFGVHGESYLRLSYANSLENIEEALERMRRVLESP